jgi:hypothetical protein
VAAAGPDVSFAWVAVTKERVRRSRGWHRSTCRIRCRPEKHSRLQQHGRLRRWAGVSAGQAQNGLSVATAAATATAACACTGAAGQPARHLSIIHRPRRASRSPLSIQAKHSGARRIASAPASVQRLTEADGQAAAKRPSELKHELARR